MENNKTILVLGAGASWDYDFPLGEVLKNEIIRNIKSKKRVYDEVIKVLGSKNGVSIYYDAIEDFANRLEKAIFPSVDAFLENNPKYLEIGKLFIAATLLPYEKKEALFDKWRDNEQKRSEEQKKHWYELLIRKIISSDGMLSNDFVVITFNYDRSFEHYLFETIMSSYENITSKEECVKRVNQIDIIHIYGSLGRLPWQIPQGLLEGVEEVQFGYVFDKTPPSNIKKAADSIKIMHESADDTNELKQAREHLKTARRIYFLGFGYHPTNLTRLIKGLTAIDAEIRGTMYKMSPKDKMNAWQKIGKVQPPGYSGAAKYDFPDKTVYDFLYDLTVI